MAPVTVERSESVAILSIDRPAERNALSAAVADALVEELTALYDTATRCVLLRGEGDTFCAGGDIGADAALVRDEISTEGWADRQARIGEAVAAVYDCPVPTIAAVDGPAVAEGGCLALSCDIRLASTDAAIGFGFRRFGQAAAAGASYLLPRAVGRDVAAHLLYTGALVDAHTAAERGLFTRVVPPGEFEDELASLTATVSTGPAAAMQANKKLLENERESLSGALDAERDLRETLVETADFREGVESVLERREPDF
jgi:enoyl-CoA hydratase/carnithine racemase